MPNAHWYQRADAAVMARRRGTMLAYEAGGGKTAAMIEAAKLAAPDGPWWFTTRRDALDNWRKELELWAPGFSNFTLCHHEAAGNFARAGAGARFVGIDESDEARNVETELFRILYPICMGRSPYGPKRVVCATATPVHNGPVDLLAPLILCGVYSWEQYQSLLFYYADPSLDGFAGLDTRGASHLDELSQVLSAVMIRRTYADFGFRMPQPVFFNQPAEAAAGAQGQAYRHASGDFSAWFKQTRGRAAPPLARFVTLRRLLELAKIPAAIEAVRLDLAAGARSLSFCEFRDTALALHKEFKGSGLVIGGDTAAGRTEVLETLEATDKAPIFATAGALRSALNMQAIDRVTHVSMGWDPSAYPQTAGRAWRQGRRDPVLLRRLFFPQDDLEKYVETVLLRKEEVLKTLGLLPTLNVGALLAA
jgi:hypothetical protein